MDNSLHELLVILVTIVSTTFFIVVALPYLVLWIELRKVRESSFSDFEEAKVKFSRSLVNSPKSFTLTLSKESCGVRWGLNEAELDGLEEACNKLREYFKNNPPGAHFDEESLDSLLTNVEFFLDRHADLKNLLKKNGDLYDTSN